MDRRLALLLLALLVAVAALPALAINPGQQTVTSIPAARINEGCVQGLATPAAGSSTVAFIVGGSSTSFYASVPLTVPQMLIIAWSVSAGTAVCYASSTVLASYSHWFGFGDTPSAIVRVPANSGGAVTFSGISVGTSSSACGP